MEARFHIIALGKQDVILGLPWLEEENLLIDWRYHTIQWLAEPWRNIYVLFNKEVEEPTLELVISFVQGKMMDDTKEIWKDAKMIKDEVSNNDPFENLKHYLAEDVQEQQHLESTG